MKIYPSKLRVNRNEKINRGNFIGEKLLMKLIMEIRKIKWIFKKKENKKF